MAALTLADARDLEMTLTAWCLACHRHEDLDLEALIAKLGPGYEVPDLNGRLSCQICGSRESEVRVSPRTTPRFS